MQVKSDSDIANAHADKIGEAAEYSWHDQLNSLDETTTILACGNMKAMYDDEQTVTQLVIDDMTKEKENLSTISNGFLETDAILSGLLSNL